MLLHVESNCRPSMLDLVSSYARGRSTTEAVYQGEERFELFIIPSQSVSYFSPVRMVFVASCVQISSAKRKLTQRRGLQKENAMTSGLCNSK